MAAPVCALVTVKAFAYRLNTAEEWSNKYMFTGTTPADPAAWRALLDALILQEKPILLAGQVDVIKAYGYDSVADDATAVWSVDLRVAPNAPVFGTFSPTGLATHPGDSAWWIRWGLNRMVKGKRVYLRKYYHPAVGPTSSPDLMAPTLVTAANTFATKMQDGTFIDGRTLTDHLGSTILNHGVSAYATTRTLKRRPKRHPTSP